MLSYPERTLLASDFLRFCNSTIFSSTVSWQMNLGHKEVILITFSGISI